MLMGLCPCATHFSDVTLKNDSDISVVATAVVVVRCGSHGAGFRLIPHHAITRVTRVGRTEGGRKRVHR